MTETQLVEVPLCSIKTASLTTALKALIGLGGPGCKALLKFNEGGLATSMLDPTYSAMAFVTLAAEGPDAPVEFDVDCSQFLEAVKPLGAETTLSIKGADLILASGRRRRTMRLPDMGKASTPKAMPELPTAAEIAVKSDELLAVCKAAAPVYGGADFQKLQFTQAPGALNVEAKGKTDSYEESIATGFSEGDGASHIYAIDFLTTCVTPAPKGSEVLLTMTEPGPMRIAYNIPGGSATFMVAPIVEDDA